MLTLSALYVQAEELYTVIGRCGQSIGLVLVRGEDEAGVDEKEKDGAQADDVLAGDVGREEFDEELHGHEGASRADHPRKHPTVLHPHFALLTKINQNAASFSIKLMLLIPVAKLINADRNLH